MSVNLLFSNNKKLDIFKINTKWAVKKCLRLNFYAYRKPRNSKNKSVYSIVGHPVEDDENIHMLNIMVF